MRLGIMVGLRDFRALRVSGADFSELLLFDGDLEGITPELVGALKAHQSPPIEFLHVQEFLKCHGEKELVDLSSDDEGIRERSVEVVARTRHLADELGRLKIVVHPGGIRPEAGSHERLLSNLRQSLADLGPRALLLENMPWYYWYRKEHRYVSSLCVTVEDMTSLEDLVEGFALDACHGYLSRPEGDPGYCARFLGSLARKTLHVHASDALPPDREGLQIGEGNIDFSIFSEIEVPILVEVWRGHADGGAGFRVGIERFRAFERQGAQEQKRRQ